MTIYTQITFNIESNSFTQRCRTYAKRCPLLAILYMQNSKTGNFYTFVISNNQSLISQVLKVVDPLGEKFKIVSSFGFNIKRNLITKL